MAPGTSALNTLTAMPLPEGYTVRRLTVEDYNRGVLSTLTALTTVGNISLARFTDVVKQWDSLKLLNGIPMYNPVVILNDTDEVVATGMVLLEEKLIHECGIVGHIEDIAVRSDQQGKSLGKLLIKQLTQIAKDGGAYKVILDCDPKNVGFYGKCGYKEAGVEMQCRFDK